MKNQIFNLNKRHLKSKKVEKSSDLNNVIEINVDQLKSIFDHNKINKEFDGKVRVANKNLLIQNF